MPVLLLSPNGSIFRAVYTKRPVNTICIGHIGQLRSVGDVFTIVPAAASVSWVAGIHVDIQTRAVGIAKLRRANPAIHGKHIGPRSLLNLIRLTAQVALNRHGVPPRFADVSGANAEEDEHQETLEGVSNAEDELVNEGAEGDGEEPEAPGETKKDGHADGILETAWQLLHLGFLLLIGITSHVAVDEATNHEDKGHHVVYKDQSNG